MKNLITPQRQRHAIVLRYFELNRDFEAIIRQHVQREYPLYGNDELFYNLYFAGWTKSDIAEHEKRFGGTFEITIISDDQYTQSRSVTLPIREIIEAYEAGEHLSDEDDEQ